MAKKLGTLKVKRLFLGVDNGERGTEVTSSAAELNVMDGVTASAEELNQNDNMWSSVTTTAVDGEDGTATVQFVFKDAAGVTMATPIAGKFYMSEVATGLTVDAADTSIAVLTNGVIAIGDTGVVSFHNFVTSAAGLLGLTITSTADSYWICFVHPTGKLVISDEITITSGG